MDITCASNAAGRPAFRRKMCALQSSGKAQQAGLARLSAASNRAAYSRISSAYVLEKSKRNSSMSCPAPAHLQLIILFLKVCEQHVHAICGLDSRQVAVKRISQCVMAPLSVIRSSSFTACLSAGLLSTQNAAKRL